MSTVFRVQKNANYTTMSNFHLKDKRLSYKAKGLLSVILSLPDEWDYSLKGLARISDDGVDGVRGGIRELEKFGYISRGKQTRNELGRMSSNEYFVYENPEQNPFFNPENETAENRITEPNSTALENPTRLNSDASTAWEKPITEKPSTEKPSTENPTTGTYYNNKILNNQVLNNQSIHQSSAEDSIDGIDEIDFNSSKNSDFSFSEKEKESEKSRADYLETIRENVEYECISEKRKVQADELIAIMLDVICSRGGTVRVNGGELPREDVKARFLSLKCEHIEYVLDAMARAAPDIRNIRAYLITALYNAPTTIDNYYSSMAVRDMVRRN